MNNITELELKEQEMTLSSLEEQFAEIDELFGMQSFGLSALSAEESESIDALDSALEDSDLMTAENQAGELSLLDVADGNFDEAAFMEQWGWPKWPKIIPNPGDIFKNKAKNIIRKIIRLVKKYRKYAKCIPTLTQAVTLYKKGKYVSALKKAYAAYRCIKRA